MSPFMYKAHHQSDSSPDIFVLHHKARKPPSNPTCSHLESKKSHENATSKGSSADIGNICSIGENRRRRVRRASTCVASSRRSCCSRVVEVGVRKAQHRSRHNGGRVQGNQDTSCVMGTLGRRVGESLCLVRSGCNGRLWHAC